MSSVPVDLNTKVQAIRKALPKTLALAAIYFNSRFALVMMALFICGCAGLLSNGTMSLYLKWMAVASIAALVAGFAVSYRIALRKAEEKNLDAGNIRV
jgi:hypothetical protein